MDPKPALLSSLRGVRRLTREIVVAMPAEEMGYRPIEDQMDFGTQALHILSAYVTLIDALNGKGWEWEKGIDRNRFPTKEAILALYDSETERLLNFVDEMEQTALESIVTTGWGTQESVAELLNDWITHEAHHRGQMVVYLRLKGITPPNY